MRKIRTSKIALLFVILLVSTSLRSQVWFPEGVYSTVTPQIIRVDNQIISIGKISSDLVNSYWLISIYDGKLWNKLPILILDKNALVHDICRVNTSLFVAGNFELPNDTNNCLVVFADEKWKGLANFKRESNLRGSVNSIEPHAGTLLIGGGFFTVNGDTIPNLCQSNGNTFSSYFKCQDCAPNAYISDIESSDTIIAFSGGFNRINNQFSKFIYQTSKFKNDTFINTPELIEKVALGKEQLIAIGGQGKNKNIYSVGNAFVDIKFNIDSFSELYNVVIWDNVVVLNGRMNTKTASNLSPRIMILNQNEWTDISNNYTNSNYIATGRNQLFAAGFLKSPISIWNPNTQVVRFHSGMCLVKAKVFLDSNDNCIQESNEKGLSKQFIKLPFLNRWVITTEKGHAEFMVPNVNNNTYRFVVKPYKNIVRSNCADTSVTKTFNKGNFMDSIQFPLKRIPNLNDIRVSISSAKGKSVIKNKRVIYYITYENVGSNSISGQVFLRRNKGFSSDFSVPALNVVNDSVLSWDYSLLRPGEQKTIVYSGLPSGNQFNDDFHFDAAAYTSITNGNNANPEDDSDSIPQEVNQSLSAFRKDVYPTPSLGDSVTYIGFEDRDLRFNISFNNFGADTVFYAVVIDTLDLNLDMSYIQETGSNKSYYTEVQTDPNNDYKGILIWHFPNIKLAPNPSMDYEAQGSGAFIGFKVITKPLSSGYVLKNTASVFFDNSYAGSTNTVYVKLSITSIQDIHLQTKPLSMYPNPCSERVILQSEISIGSILTIRDVLGRVVFSKEILSESDLEVMVSDWENGIYSIGMVNQQSKAIGLIVVSH